jgi:hypothetical protein
MNTMDSAQRSALLSVFLAALIASAGCDSASTPTEPTDAPVIQITIEVAPNVLNIQSEGQVVTVHTDLAYGYVVASSVLLNGVKIDSWKADDRGNFVAKFVMSAIKNLPLSLGQLNTLRIDGTATDGKSFWGSKGIMVVSNAG